MTTLNGGDDDDELLAKLQELLARLERLSLDYKVAEPAREQEIDDLRPALEDAIATLAQQRRWDREGARIEERLTALERAMGDGGGRFERFERRDEIESEARYISGQLKGSSTNDAAPNYLAKGERASVQPGIDVLRAAMTTKKGV